MGKNDKFLSAFSLFSALFKGHFISNLLRKRKTQKKIENVLNIMFRVYGQNHDIECDDDEHSPSTIIPMYVQQLFFNLMEGFKSERKHFVIRSEYEKLGDALKGNLMSFNDCDDEKESSTISVFPFLNAVCDSKSIKIMKEYIWILSDDELTERKGGAFGHTVWSEEFMFKLEGGGSVVFALIVGRAPSGRTTSGFGIKIKKCAKKRVSGQMSVMVDELEWLKNGYTLNSLKEGSHDGFFAFEERLVEEMESLTVRVALHLE